MQITISLTDAQAKALGTVALDVTDYLVSAVTVTANRAIEEIVASEVQRKLAAGESITGSKDDIVMAANVESAAQRQARMEAEAAARVEAGGV